MFNQRLHHFISENADFINNSYNAPNVSPLTVHNCITPHVSYVTSNKEGMPLQTWLDKNLAVEMFGMRPIVNTHDYFNSIKSYLSELVIKDREPLDNSGLMSEEYNLVMDTGDEPFTSFLSMVNMDLTNKLNVLMANSADNVDIFKNFNPICEGFVITDIKITNYMSDSNNNHLYNLIVFSAVNTTRYNTISFKAEIYQDVSNIIDSWNTVINEAMNSKDISIDTTHLTSDMYIYNLSLLNDIDCVLGVESDCEIKPYSILNNTDLKEYMHPSASSLFQENSYGLSNTTYDNYGNYSTGGELKIVDNGPDNLNNLIKELGY